MFEIAGLVVVAAVAWFWLDAVRVRDLAVAAARRACAAEGVQFLDESVAVDRLHLARDDDGQLVLRRVYGFEFSDTGNDRRPGDIVVLGHRVQQVNLALSAAIVPLRRH